MLKARQRLGKYRIDGRIAKSGFANVYRATDIIEGRKVALKIPLANFREEPFLSDFRKEVRLAGKLEHPNILPLKDANFIRGHFVIVTPLGDGTLDDRLQKRVALPQALDFADQMLTAVACAHERRIIHCDIKPDNFIMFPGNQLRLGDFGISKLAMRTVKASGSGTLGYLAPEQAMGRPSFRSDVFSLGLVIYRMFGGALPEWPFDWPPRGIDRLRRRVSRPFAEFLRRSIEVNPARRFRDAGQMLAAFRKLKPRAIRAAGTTSRLRRRPKRTADWQEVRIRQFKQQHGRALEAHFDCAKCGGPVSEPMTACPWCGTSRKLFRGETRFPARCSRCRRGNKLDWRFCAWCYGSQRKQVADRSYSDKRYEARCGNPSCRGQLMRFMRYCPWCRSKVQRRWKIAGTSGQCPRCRGPVLKDYWGHCPWCQRSLRRHG